MKNQFRRAVLILAIFVILAGIHLFIYTKNIDLKYKLTKVKVELQEIISQNRQLGSRLATKKNLKYVESYAKEKLGMVYPEKINYIVLTASSETKL